MTQKAAALAYRAQAAIEAVQALLAETSGIEEAGTEEIATVGYAVRHTLTQAVKQVDSALTTTLTERWSVSQAPYIVDGLPPITVRRTAKSIHWPHHDRTAAAVIDAHLRRDHTDGDLPLPWDVQRWILDAAGISYWRTTDLRSLGIDPDEHRIITRGHPTVDYG
jgi:hypothetical protein